eukprot:1140104-Pelagomonas_calceolata.AAC.3
MDWVQNRALHLWLRPESVSPIQEVCSCCALANQQKYSVQLMNNNRTDEQANRIDEVQIRVASMGNAPSGLPNDSLLIACQQQSFLVEERTLPAVFTGWKGKGYIAVPAY